MMPPRRSSKRKRVRATLHSRTRDLTTPVASYPVLALMLAVPAYSNLRIRRRNEGQLACASAFANAYAVTGLANLLAADVPVQTQTWADLKAAYRLLNAPDVTPAALSTPHGRQARAVAAGPEPVLFIQDTRELDDTAHPHTRGVGHIGDGRGRGFELHRCPAVRPAEPPPDGAAPRGRRDRADAAVRCIVAGARPRRAGHARRSGVGVPRLDARRVILDFSSLSGI
jgi:hypothetical protein